MLMSFGPGVLFLFARRFRDLRRAQGGDLGDAKLRK